MNNRQIRDDVQKVLKELYERTHRWQAKQGKQVDMTLAEFTGLWSNYRINKLEKLLDSGPAALRSYLRNPNTKPVCGWKSPEDRNSGVMTAKNAVIDMAETQRRKFQFRKGDTHSPETIQKMKKPKSLKTRQRMSEAAKARHARNKESNND